MGALLLAAIGLGLAGLDPAGALVAVGSLAAGARRGAVLGYGAVVIGGSAALGITLSLTLGVRLRTVDVRGLLPRGGLAAIIEVVLGLGLLGWAAWRTRERPAGEERTGRAGVLTVLGLGVAYASLSLVDPTFAGLVVLAGRGQPVPAVVGAHLLWSVSSQLPLTVLLVAVAAGAHEGAVTWFRRWWGRVGPVLARVVTVLLVLGGAGLLADAGLFLLTGRHGV